MYVCHRNLYPSNIFFYQVQTWEEEEFLTRSLGEIVGWKFGTEGLLGFLTGRTGCCTDIVLDSFLVLTRIKTVLSSLSKTAKVRSDNCDTLQEDMRTDEAHRQPLRPAEHLSDGSCQVLLEKNTFPARRDIKKPQLSLPAQNGWIILPLPGSLMLGVVGAGKASLSVCVIRSNH